MKRPIHPSDTEGVPLVSFLIVAYNETRFLDRCLQSALAQTHPRIEVVLVDDASTDGSVAAVARDPSLTAAVRIVRTAVNLGWASGAVTGLPFCQGEFIARLDADDLVPPERIERQVDYLRKHPEKDAVGGDVMMIDGSGGWLDVRPALRTEFLRRHGAKWHVGTNHTTLLLRRRAFAERFYNPTMATNADYEYIEWLAVRGRLGRQPGIMGFYRQHASSISQSRTALQRLSGSEFRKRVGQAGGDVVKRNILAVEDFSWLRADPRLSQPSVYNADQILRECREQRNWLTAAYFASTIGRWGEFFSLLLRASVAGAPWREILALLLMRTGWPVWKRLFVRTVRWSGGRAPSGWVSVDWKAS